MEEEARLNEAIQRTQSAEEKRFAVFQRKYCPESNCNGKPPAIDSTGDHLMMQAAQDDVKEDAEEIIFDWEREGAEDPWLNGSAGAEMEVDS